MATLTLEELAKRLTASITPALDVVALAMATQTKRYTSPYPPSSSANNPNHMVTRYYKRKNGAKMYYGFNQWYERGYGTRYRTKKGIGGRKTSQFLNRKWRIRALGNGQAELVNEASYSGYVHGDRQAAIHKKRNWRTIGMSVDRLKRENFAARLMIKEFKKAIKLDDTP